MDTVRHARRASDGGLEWSAEDPELQQSAALKWSIGAAEPVRIGKHTFELDLTVATDRVEAATLTRLASLLSSADTDETFRKAIADNYVNDDYAKGLVADLFGALHQGYLADLFPGCSDAANVAIPQFLGSLTLGRIGYYDVSEYHQGAEHVVADYRFLVTKLKPEPDRDPNDYLQYGDRYDVTNQAVVVIATLDGQVVRVTHES